MVERVLTGQRNLEYCVKQKLKELAAKRGLSGDKSRGLVELESLLSQNLKGFSLRKNFLNKSMTMSWFEEGKLMEITYAVDPVSGEIYEESSH